MAITYTNTDGAVCVTDGGTPRIISVKAGGNISGGYWVNGSSSVGAVGSSASSFDNTEIVGLPVATQCGSNCIGMALTDITSGTWGPVAMRGIFLVPGGSGTKLGSIFAGQPLLAGSAGTVIPVCSGTVLPLQDAVGDKCYPIGRALTAGGIITEAVAISLNI